MGAVGGCEGVRGRGEKVGNRDWKEERLIISRRVCIDLGYAKCSFIKHPGL